MELLADVFDPNLHILDQLSECNSPNSTHSLLAEFLKKNHVVFTTNFDCLIEKACVNKGLAVQSVYSNEQNLLTGTNAVWKLHGSLQDENGQDTRKSVVATMRRLGQKGEAFCNDPYLREAFVNNIRQHDLIVLGYSGSDDFDIVPMISQTVTKKSIFWIWHEQNTSPMEILDYRTFKTDHKNASEILDKIFLFGNWKDDQIVIIVGRTAEIVAEIGKILVENSKTHQFEKEFEIPYYYYSQWGLKYNLEKWRRYRFIGKFLQLIGEYEAAHQYYLLALSEADGVQEFFPKILILQDLSGLCIRGYETKLALRYLDEFYSLLNDNQDSQFYELGQKLIKDDSRFYTNYYQHLAMCYFELGRFEEALEVLDNSKPLTGTIEYARKLYEGARIHHKMGNSISVISLVEEAIEIHRNLGNLDSLAICLLFLSSVLFEKNECTDVREHLREISTICKITNNARIADNCKRLKLAIRGKGLHN